MVASLTPPTGDLACNPGMCPDWESIQLPFDLQTHAQPIELHQLGWMTLTFKKHRISTRRRNPGRVGRKVGAVTAEPGACSYPLSGLKSSTTVRSTEMEAKTMMLRSSLSSAPSTEPGL